MKKFTRYIKENRTESTFGLDKDDYMIYSNQLLSLFLNKTPSKEIYDEYLSDEDGHLVMQDFINANIKVNFNWMTGISIMEAVENMIEDAKSNGNIK